MQQFKKFKDLPWENPVYEDVWYSSYMAPEPLCKDHKIYVPKENTMGCISAAFVAAVKVGDAFVGSKQWSAFKIVMEIGENAGQTIGWPHLHLLPVLV